MSLSPRIHKLLWGNSGAKCAYCRGGLIQAGSPSAIVGDEAHIVATSILGPRGGFEPPGGEIDGEQNVILLCKTRHKLIDDLPDVYTVEALVEMKRGHELWVASLESPFPSIALDVVAWEETRSINDGSLKSDDGRPGAIEWTGLFKPL